MSKIVLSFLLIFVFENIFSQTNINAIETTRKDSIQKEQLLKKINRLLYSQPDSAKFYVLQLKHIGETNYDYLTIASAYNKLGIIADVKGNWDEALSLYKETIQFADKASSKKIKANALNNIGIIYSNRGNQELAMVHYHQALSIFEEIGNNYSISNSLNNIGTILQSQKQYKEALIYYKKSITKAKTSNNKTIIGFAYSNISDLFSETKKIDSSMFYMQLAIRANKENDNMLGLINSYNNMGNLYKNDNNIDKALSYFRKSINISNKNKNTAIPPLLNIAEIYKTVFNDNIKAEKYLKEAIDIAEKSGANKQLIIAYDALGEIYYDRTKFQLSSDYLFKRITLYDSLYNVERDEKIAELQTKYETTKKQQKIDLLNEANKTKEHILKSRGYLIISLILIILLLILLAFVLKQKSGQKLQKIESELQKYILQVAEKSKQDNNMLGISSKQFIDKYDLSEREAEILNLLSKGLTYDAIGKKIYLSNNTVKYHIGNLYLKLNVMKKSEALKKFYE